MGRKDIFSVCSHHDSWPIYLWYGSFKTWKASFISISYVGLHTASRTALHEAEFGVKFQVYKFVFIRKYLCSELVQCWCIALILELVKNFWLFCPRKKMLAFHFFYFLALNKAPYDSHPPSPTNKGQLQKGSSWKSLYSFILRSSAEEQLQNSWATEVFYFILVWF